MTAGRDFDREFTADFDRTARLMSILGGTTTGRRLKNGGYSMGAKMPCAGRIYVRSKRGQTGNEAAAAVMRHVREWVERHARRAYADLSKRLVTPKAEVTL